jgi:predicted molibdopterin-dependent oxidoreductase YjgC
MSYQVSIDGRSLSIEAGRTVLQAARENGIDIPTLCDFQGLTSHGSCRMCIVEIEGRSNTPTSCTTLVENGMVIQTNSPRVRSMRSELLKLLLSEHPSGCLFCDEKSHCDECMVTLKKTGVTTGCRSCPSDEQCELQTLVDRFGLTGVGYPVRYRMLPVEKKDPFFDRDYNLCILCERCVRVCEENHFSSTLTLASRGTDAIVSTAFGNSLLQAGCNFCGACVEVCPTGTLTEKTRKWDGKPDREVSTTCPLCSVGCQINLLVKNEMVIGSLPDHASGTDVLCVKGRFGITELVNHPARLQHPIKIDNEGTVPVAWEQAVEIAAEKISTCAPEKYGMVISADCSNETLYVAQKFVRDVVGSKSLRLSSAAAYGTGLQIIKRLYALSKPLSIMSEAEVILCMGFDGKYSQSVVETNLYHAKRSGTQLITFNARDHNLGRFADEWLKPVPGNEWELLKMLVESVGEETVSDQGQLSPMASNVQHSVRLLKESKRPAILVGSDFLTHSDNFNLLVMLEQLIAKIGASLIILPDPVNLTGAIQLGLTTSPTMADIQQLEVLHLIGETISMESSRQPFMLYQNIYPAVQNIQSGLILPATAFTEEDGTVFDHSGTMRSIHRVVDAPGNALPSWQVLCRIAQKLGVSGFDFENAEQIQTEFEASIRFGVVSANKSESAQTEADVLPLSYSEDHSYMGFPLRNWVAGYRVLDPDHA